MLSCNLAGLLAGIPKLILLPGLSMKINYIEYLKKDRILDSHFFPDMPDEQAENVYCDLIVQISRLSSYYDNFILLSLVALIGVVLFSGILLAVDDPTILQSILILTGLGPCCLAWIYFSIGAYVLTYRQPKIEKSLAFIEREYPSVANHFSNEIIFYYSYFGGERLSYARALLLSIIASPICCLFFLCLNRLDCVDSSDVLSVSLMCMYIALMFIGLNFLYIKFCKIKSDQSTKKST